MTNLFTLNEATFQVELNKEWISTIKEFKALLVRDKGTEKGDANGRKKARAQKEFTFIYHYCDYRSQFNNYSEKDRFSKALTNAELPENYKVWEDEELTAAVEVYLALQDTPSLKLLIELEQGIHLGRKVVKKIRENLENQLDNLDTLMDESSEESKEAKTKKAEDPITKIKNRLDQITDIANKLPTTLKVVKELMEDVKKELAETPNLKGGATKGWNEDGGKVSIQNPFDN